MENQTIDLLQIIGVTEAGFYALKGLGYMWLKSRSQDLPELEMQQRAEDTLKLAKNAFLFPTPFDIFYIARGITRLIKKYSPNRDSCQFQETVYPVPYSKCPRTLDFVDMDLVDLTQDPSSQPFNFHRQQLKLVDQ